MKTKASLLTKQERDLLIMAAQNSNGNLLSKKEIGQRLGVSVTYVNRIIHQACIKLGAQDKSEAILLALKRGEINLNEFWLPEELEELFSSLDPDMLRRMIDIMRKELDFLEKNQQTILTYRRQDSVLTNWRGLGGTLRKRKVILLTKQERDLLIMAAQHANGNFPSNKDIGQHVGMSVNAVNRIIHQACVKMGAHSKYEAIILALKRREIILTDFCSIDELAELFSSLGPDILRKIANIAHQGLVDRDIRRNFKQTTVTSRKQDGILTNRERDIVILVGLGFTNKEIADKLFITIGSVRIFLNRACAKLGTRKRPEVFMLALKKREIIVADVYSLNEIIIYLSPLGADTLEEMAQLVERKFCQDPVPTFC